MSNKKLDFSVQYEGKVCLFHPQTEAAKTWLATYVSPDAQYFGKALVVEDRYVGSLAFAMTNDGLSVA